MIRFWKLFDFKTIWKNYSNYRRSGVMGDRICLEACTMCQLRCPVCLQSTSSMELRGRGYLKFDDFRKFVDRYPQFTRIELSNYGEIFLNPELGEIIEYAHKKSIRLSALSGTNLNTVSEEMVERLVRCRFDAMTVALDGASPQTYAIYRRGGNFDTVIGNVRKINAYKKKYGSEYPRLIWQFVVFGHNEHELPSAARMARELDMEFFPKYNSADPSYAPVKNREWVEQQLEELAGQSWQYFSSVEQFHLCEQFWLTPQINWDGRLLGCCFNRWEDFGNVFTDGLKQCLRSAKYRASQKYLRRAIATRPDIPCPQCPLYRRVGASVYEMMLRRLFE